MRKRGREGGKCCFYRRILAASGDEGFSFEETGGGMWGDPWLQIYS